MEPIQAVVLGIIQGLTEFLPVSSSGHLVIFQHLFGLKETMVSFDISVHFGTLLVVIIVFRKKIIELAASLIRIKVLFLKKKDFFSNLNQDKDLRLLFLIIIGSVPTGIIGLLFEKIADRLFSSIFIAGSMLIVTGCFLWATRYINKKKSKGIEGFSSKDAILIGIAQGFAIIPGISRSGFTIAAGLFLGLNRETAARYSFLLSVPAIAGAEILSLKDLASGTLASIKITLLGVLISFIVGYMALKLLLFIVRKGQMHYFAPYCWLAGAAALIPG